jgi:GrpB-like predicted nucleotidyltransferase (UPF0157 family)
MINNANPSTEIVLEQHKPEWVLNFQRMKHLSEDLFGKTLLRLEHFGSTSIPGIVAKPIIDMIGHVTSLTELDGRVAEGLPSTIKCLGENGVSGRRYFVFDFDDGVKGHSHLFEPGNREYDDRILFRDYLQQNHETARQYEELKTQLCAAHGNDPVAYWRGKQTFVKGVVELARIKKSEAIEGRSV